MASVFGSSSSSGGSVFGGSSSSSSGGMSPLMMMAAGRFQQQPDEGEGGLLGLLGNAWEGITGTVEGVSKGLVGGLLHDFGQGVGNAVAAIPGVDEVEAGIFNSTEDKSQLLALGKGLVGAQEVNGKTEWNPLAESSLAGNIYHRWKPLVTGVGDVLSGQGTEDLEEFASGLYEDPLGAVLDVASVASLGAGAAAKLTKAGVAAKVGLGPTSTVAEIAERVPAMARTLEDLATTASVAPRTARAAAIRAGAVAEDVGGPLSRALLPKQTYKLVEGAGLTPTAEIYNPLFRAAGAPVRHAMTESLDAFKLRGGAAEQAVKEMPAVLKNLGDVEKFDTTYKAAEALGMKRIETPYFATKNASLESSKLYAKISGRSYAARNKAIRDDEYLQTFQRIFDEHPDMDLEAAWEQAQGLHTAGLGLERQPWATRQGYGHGQTGVVSVRPSENIHITDLGDGRVRLQGVHGAGEGAGLNRADVPFYFGSENVAKRRLDTLGGGDLHDASVEGRFYGIDNPLTEQEVAAKFASGELTPEMMNDYDGIVYRSTEDQALGGDSLSVNVFEGSRGKVATSPVGGGVATATRTTTRTLPEAHPVREKGEAALENLRLAREEWAGEKGAMREAGEWDVAGMNRAFDELEAETRAAMERAARHEAGEIDLPPEVQMTDEFNMIDINNNADGLRLGTRDALSMLDRKFRPWQGMYGREKDWSAETDLARSNRTLEKVGKRADERVAKAQAKANKKIRDDLRTAESGRKTRLGQAEARARKRVREAEAAETRAQKAFDNAKDPGNKHRKQQAWLAARREAERVRDAERTHVREVQSLEDGRVAKAQERVAETPGAVIDREAAKVSDALAKVEVDNARNDAQFAGGPDLFDTARAFREAGIPHPAYIPHMDLTDMKMQDFFTAKQTMGANIRARNPSEQQMKLVLLKRGTASKDFKEVLTRRVARQIREEETFRMWETILTRFGAPIAEGDMIPNGYKVVAPDMLFINHRSRKNLLNRADEYIAKGNDVDSAMARAMKETLDENYDNVKAIHEAGTVKMYAVPEVVLKKLDQAARYSPAFGGPGVQLSFDQFMNVWRGLTLTASPRWVVNNVLGNVAFGAMQGVKTADVLRIGGEKFRILMQNYFRRKVGSKKPQLTGPREKSLAGQVRKKMEEGNVEASHGYLQQEIGRTQHLGRQAQQTRLGKIEMGMQSSWGARQTRRWGESAKSINGTIEDAFREASWLTAVEKAQGRTAIRRTANSFGRSQKRMERIVKGGFDENVAQQALKDMEHFFGAYGSMTPFERHVVRRWIFPFWGFYRHSTKLMLSFPFEYPGRAHIFAGFSRINQELQDQFGPRPEWLEGALSIGPPGSDQFMTTRGLDPFSGASEGLQGIANMLGPLPKAVLEASTGRSTFTGEEFTDRNVVELYGGERMRIIRDEDGNIIGAEPVEKVAPSFLNQIASTVPQMDMLKDLIAGGTTYDTASLADAIQQRFGDAGEATPIDPATGQPFSPTGLAEILSKFSGMPITQYSLADYQQRLLEQQEEAIRLAYERMQTEMGV